jgi:antitoxin YqcF
LEVIDKVALTDLVAEIESSFGAKPKIVSYDIKKQNGYVAEIALATAVNGRSYRYVSYSTVGLSLIPLVRTDSGKEYRLELVSACAVNSTDWYRVILNAASFIAEEQWACSPGCYIEKIVSPEVSKSLRHLVFAYPTLWKMSNLIQIHGLPLRFLLILPITDGELQFLKDQGFAKLEERLVEADFNCCDLNRESVV